MFLGERMFFLPKNLTKKKFAALPFSYDRYNISQECFWMKNALRIEKEKKKRRSKSFFYLIFCLVEACDFTMKYYKHAKNCKGEC